MKNKKTACLKKKQILSLFIRWMLNDVALFDRIYIRALIFLQLQLLRESFPDNNRGRCVTNFFPTKSGGWRGKKIIKCDDEKKPKTLFSPLFSFSLSLALLSCLGAAKWAERKEEMQRLKKKWKNHQMLCFLSSADVQFLSTSRSAILSLSTDC